MKCLQHGEGNLSRLREYWPALLILLAESLLITLYLSPTKESKAFVLGLAVALGLVVQAAFSKTALTFRTNAVLPFYLVAAISYACFYFTNLEATAPFYLSLIAALVPLFIFQQTASPSLRDGRKLIVPVLLIAGWVQLAVMWMDIVRTVLTHPEIIGKDSRHGLIEFLKDLPRVGRRHLSLAMVQTLVCSVALLFADQCPPRRWLRRFLKFTAILAAASLVVLDARSAYVSIILAGVIVFGVRADRAGFARRIRTAVPSRRAAYLLVVIVSLALALGYSAGRSRWLQMGHSLETAIADTFDSDQTTADRPYVDLAFWNQDVADVDACIKVGNTRCVVDQSAYLRLAWTIEGVRSLFIHPLGIGYSADYMGRYWNVAGIAGKYQFADSYFTLLAVCFGWPGVLSVAWILVEFALRLRTLPLSADHAGEFALLFIIITLVIRMTYDQMTDGLWSYLLALIGSASTVEAISSAKFPDINGERKADRSSGNS